MKRISVETAAKELNMTPLTVRYLMQQQRLPIGFAQKREGCSRTYYIVFEELVQAFRKKVESGDL